MEDTHIVLIIRSNAITTEITTHLAEEYHIRMS